MKIILHLGIPKTGTTSLQEGLAANNAQLLQAGYLYPNSPVKPESFHHILGAFFGDPNTLAPYLMRRFGTIENAIRNARSFLEQAYETAKKFDCHTIILSSELLLPAHGKNIRLLGAALSKITVDIQPVLYVREPADLYKSRLQQKAKKIIFWPPYPLRAIQHPIEEIEREFGKRAIVRAFHRDQLQGGDILEDFCSGVLHLDGQLFDFPRLRENSSMSAEALCSLLAYGEWLEASGKSKDARIPRQIAATIRRSKDKGNEFSKLVLKPKLTHDIRAAATEYIWLRERYGINFPELDYGRITEKEVDNLKKYKKISDVIEIDTTKTANFLMPIMDSILNELHEKHAEVRRKKPEPTDRKREAHGKEKH